MMTSLFSPSTKLFAVLLFASLWFETSRADFNPIDGSFRTVSVDAEIPFGDSFFQLRRFYSSRSLHDGLFGFGWCTDIEKRIDLRRSDQITLYDCTLSSEIIYRKNANGEFEKPKDAPPSFARTFLITERAYVLKTPALQLTFDLRGRVSEISTGATRKLAIQYTENGTPEKIRISTTELKLRMDPGKRYVAEITGPREIKITYAYRDRNLISVTLNQASAKSYAYDKLDNLTELNESPTKSEKIEYDAHYDRVAKWTSSNGCEQAVAYKMISKKKFFTSILKTCPQKSPSLSKFEFNLTVPSPEL